MFFWSANALCTKNGGSKIDKLLSKLDFMEISSVNGLSCFTIEYHHSFIHSFSLLKFSIEAVNLLWICLKSALKGNLLWKAICLPDIVWALSLFNYLYQHVSALLLCRTEKRWRKKNWTQNLWRCENQNQVRISGKSWTWISIKTACNIIDTFSSSRTVF